MYVDHIKRLCKLMVRIFTGIITNCTVKKHGGGLSIDSEMFLIFTTQLYSLLCTKNALLYWDDKEGDISIYYL